MGRRSTRGRYTNPDIYNNKVFTQMVDPRNRKIFIDWIGGMTGGELAEKYFVADITVRQSLARTKTVYDTIERMLKDGPVA